MSSKRAERRRGAGAGASGEPDLTPIMNLTFMLILSLLTLSAVVPLGLISVQAPRLAGTMNSARDPSLNLTIVVTEEGYSLAASGATLDGDFDTPPRPGEPLLPKVNVGGRETYDFEGLSRQLIEIKHKFPREQRVNITADEDVIYEDVIKTMDASRETADGRELFPAVAFSAGFAG
jgi:biopolymer transport protein ExbD